MLERELKFAVEDLRKVRERVKELGGELLGGASKEDNWVFDKSDELRKSGCVLRLRTDRHGARLTFKGPAQLVGSVKVRQEHEVGVSEVAATTALLRSLGYQRVKRYQKVREEWQLDETVIALDVTPMGEFVEFEGQHAEAAAGRCGFRLEEAEVRNYLQLYEAYRKDHPGAPPDMVFS